MASRPIGGHGVERSGDAPHADRLAGCAIPQPRENLVKLARLLPVAVIATAAACGSPAPSSITSPPAVARASATPASTTATPTAPAPPAPTVHPLGATVAIGDGYAKVTVYAYKQPVATGAPKPDQADYGYGAADVKVCNVTGGSTVSNLPWTLTYPDSTTASPSSLEYRQFPLPEYPFGDTPLNVGQCIRGWIVFVVPEARRPATVHYALDDGTIVDWRV
jgi:hypothetical protein